MIYKKSQKMLENVTPSCTSWSIFIVKSGIFIVFPSQECVADLRMAQRMLQVRENGLSHFPMKSLLLLISLCRMDDSQGVKGR